jgi:hypothetical protein
MKISVFVLLRSGRTSVSLRSLFVFIPFCFESFDFSARPVIKPCSVSKNTLRHLLYYLRVKSDSQNDGQVMPDGGYQCFRPLLMGWEIRINVRVHSLYSRGGVSNAERERERERECVYVCMYVCVCVCARARACVRVPGHVFASNSSTVKHSGPATSCPSPLSPQTSQS